MANALITGCSSGFGLLTAQTFARRGHQVFATARDLASTGELGSPAMPSTCRSRSFSSMCGTPPRCVPP
jgi:NAD(P)-dependent dehydrogenase (short-subunit alcohol dehydrogenase family)